jgi:hypothetical protein
VLLCHVDDHSKFLRKVPEYLQDSELRLFTLSEPLCILESGFWHDDLPAYLYVCMYVCMYVCVYCMYVCMCVCAYMYVCMYVCNGWMGGRLGGWIDGYACR